MPNITSGIVLLFQLELIGLKCGKDVRRCQNNIFLFKQADSDAHLLSDLFPRAMVFPFEFYINRCSFHGLSESSLTFLGRLDDSALLSKILEKIVEKFTMNLCISTFSLEEKALSRKGHIYDFVEQLPRCRMV